MSRRNIALTIISEGIGGAEAVVKQIARRLDKSRYDCLIITNDEIRHYYQDIGVRLVSVGAIYGQSRLGRLSRALERIGYRHSSVLARLHGVRDRFAEMIREHKAELIHSHLIADHYLSSLLPSDAIRRVMTLHGGLGLDVHRSYLLGRDEVRAVMDQAAFLTSACRYFLGLLTDNGVDVHVRSAVIENGIDAGVCGECLPPLPGVTREHNGALRMVFLGGDRPLKGGDLLAKALAILVHERRRTNVHLTILRNVHRRSDLYRCVRANRLHDFVDFAGYIRNNGHIDHIRASDLFVLPSRSEGIANTLMEAIGLGKAILATDVGGTGEVISHGVNGYLCRPSPDSLAEGIEYFLKNPGRLGEFARKNVEIRSRFLWPGIVTKYEDLYDRLLTGRCISNG